MKDNDGQYRQTLKRDELNVEKFVVPNNSYNSLCVEDGHSASDANNESDADDNFSLAINSITSQSSDTTSSRESVSSIFFNSAQEEKEDTAKQFEIGIPVKNQKHF